MTAPETDSYAAQFLEKIEAVDLNQTISASEDVSLVFDGSGTSLTEDEINNLILAKEEGWVDFGQVVHQQIYPVLQDVLRKLSGENEEHRNAITTAILRDYIQAFSKNINTDNAEQYFLIYEDINLIEGLSKSPEDVAKLSSGRLIEENSEYLESEGVKSALNTFANHAMQGLVMLEAFRNDNLAALKKANPKLLQDLNTATVSLEQLLDELPDVRDKINSDNLGAILPEFLAQVSMLKQQIQTIKDANPEEEVASILGSLIQTFEDFISKYFYLMEGTAKRAIKTTYTKSALQINTLFSGSAKLEAKIQTSKMRITDRNSPAILTSPPDNKSSDLGADLQRAKDNNEVFINERPLSDYTDYDFNQEAHVSRFLTDVLLADVKTPKEEMVVYLKQKFNQGGLLWPVASAVQEAMTEHPANKRPYHGARLRDSASTHTINIMPNATGFTIQEVFKADNLLVAKNPYEEGAENPLYEASEDQTTLSALTEDTPILLATGKVQVDFSGNPAQPTLTALENTITYGHPVLASYMESLRDSEFHDTSDITHDLKKSLEETKGEHDDDAYHAASGESPDTH